MGVLAVIVGALATGWMLRRRSLPTYGLPPDRPRQLGPFELTERSGRILRRVDLEGKICVVSFVFTSCGISCLQVSRNLQRLQVRLGEDAEDVRIVSLSIDPQSDTPAVLSRFATNYAADRRWLFLTGDQDQLERLIDMSFLPRVHGVSRGPLAGKFEGTDRIVLADATGRVRGSFDGMDPVSVDALVRSIAGLRGEGNRP
ncbi:MAG: SCO family protein [Verrucomicrobiales bacterium]|nr:SCO family protein [Verrucomicrobiales bacterium]